MNGDMIDVRCPTCGWEFHAREGDLKVECLNEKCGASITLSKAGKMIETARPTGSRTIIDTKEVL